MLGIYYCFERYFNLGHVSKAGLSKKYILKTFEPINTELKLDNLLFVYSSNAGYKDELGWAAAWLYKATNQASYKQDAITWLQGLGDSYAPWAFSWADKTAGANVRSFKLH